MSKDEIAEVLTEIAVLLELKGENPFKARAYTNAARTLQSLNRPLDELFPPEGGEHIKGIGESIHERIGEMLAKGKSTYYEELKASMPPGLLEILSIPGLGPKKIKALYEKLGVETVDQLEKACLAGRPRSHVANACS